jgi:FtsZ-binding cell division protein ZapB
MQRIDSTPQLMIKVLEEEIRLLKQEVHELKKGERSLILHKDGSVQDSQYDLQTEIDRVKAENEVIRAENIRFRVLFESLQSKLNAFVI